MFTIFLILSCVIQSCLTFGQLCSNDTSFGNKCMCKTYVNPNTGLPNTLIDCHGLNLAILPSVLQQLPNDIGGLDLSLNDIVTLKPTFSTLSRKSLEKLILAHNRISYIDMYCFYELPELRTLDLSYNQISSFDNDAIFINQPKLLYLDLSFNNIKKISMAIFNTLPLLEYLDLSYNPVGDFLSNSKNFLSETLGVNRNITTLKLNNIGCKSLPSTFFDNYRNLQHLELADNQIQSIPSIPNSVEYFDFSGNMLATISAENLNSDTLKILRLSRMSALTGIQPFAFINLTHLEQLIITDCPRLKVFNELSFGARTKTANSPNTHLRILDLSRNGLQTLNSSYKLLFHNVNVIDLRFNPWNCDCEVLWLQEIEDNLVVGEELRCAAPWNLRQQSLVKLQPHSLPECHPEIYGKTSHRILIILLMIVIIFLASMVVYTLKYLNKTPRHTLVGPFSPYSRTPQEEKI